MCNSEALKKSVSKERAIGLVKNPYQATLDGLRDVGIMPKPKPHPIDPAVERAASQAAATQQANARIAFQRKAMRENSLITGGGNSGTLGVG